MTDRNLKELARETALQVALATGCAECEAEEEAIPAIEAALQRAVADAREEACKAFCYFCETNENIWHPAELKDGRWRHRIRQPFEHWADCYAASARRAFAAAQDDPEVSR